MSRNDVTKANNASSPTLFKALLSSTLGDLRVQKNGSLKLKNGDIVDVKLFRASELAEDDKDRLMVLFETNMKTLYEQSQNGYDAAEKRDEMFDNASRLVISYVRGSKDIAGFSVFRFDMEDTVEDDRQVTVVYCYEVQVDAAYRGAGLGLWLMRSLETLGRAYKMHKVMLTVFTANDAARRFYQLIGYRNDEICPSQCKSDEDELQADYEILSKPCIA